MFKVEKTDFIAELWSRTKSGSVLLSGSPGVGKSWTIAQFMRRCQREKRPQISLAAEDFDVRSVDELNRVLGFKNDIVSVLDSLGNDAALIIDGLDALRGEASQRAFRELIGNTVVQLPNCSVVASIRTFDLQQSEQLQQLFFPVGSGTHRRFTHMTVEPLSDSDLLLVCEQVQGLERLLTLASSDMRDILRNPFNLHIAARLIEAGATVDDFSAVHSQVQLLGKYWYYRVESPPDAADRRKLLRSTLDTMVSNNALSVPEQQVYSPGLSQALTGLCSSEVLRRSITNRISFAHNILFDYAIARVALDEEEFFAFIEKDSTRTIFFRPSLSYFLHYLWWRDRSAFWKVALRCFEHSNLPERARVIPAVVITEASRTITDLDPLFTGPIGSATAMTYTLRSVLALGGMQSPQRNLWLDLLTRVADQPRLDFINECISLLSAAFAGYAESDVLPLGTIARNLLLWMWAQASDLPLHQAVKLNTVAIARVFPVVMALYATDPAASKNIVVRILDRFGLPESSPNDAFWMSHEIKRVFALDSTLAVDVYKRMFAHKETSEERTEMGASTVLVMTSTRRQDFESGYYGLTVAFNDFLQTAPRDAALAAVLAVDGQIRREHPISEENLAARFSFDYRGTLVWYTPDFSEIWDHGARDHQSLQLLNNALLTSVAGADCEGIVRAIITNSDLAVCWKRLLEVASANIAAMYRYVSPLLHVPQFIAAPEITVAVGNVIKSAFESELVTKDDQVAIEAAIRELKAAKLVIRYEKPESIQNRLLLCVGTEHLQDPRLRDRAESLVRERFENRPYHQMSVSHRSFSTEDWLREEGVDPATPENSEVLRVVKLVGEFEHRFLNQRPSPQECSDIEPHLRHLSELLKNENVDSTLAEQGRGTLCAAAETILKNEKLPSDASAVLFSRDVVLRGSRDPSPEFDPKYHSSFDMPSWGSPSPRIEAAQGIAHLLWNYGPDPEVVTAFEALTKDKVPAVRFQVATGVVGFYKHKDYDRFWSILETMLGSETTPGVMLGLLEAIGRVAGADPERVVSLLHETIARGLPITERFEMTRTLVQILTGLYIARGTESAGSQLATFEADPIRFKKEIGDEVFTASHYLIPENAGPDARNRAKELLVRVLTVSYETLDRQETEENTPVKGETIIKLLQHVDEVASRLFFTLDVDEKFRNGKPGLSDASRAELYRELKPVLSLLAYGPSVAPHRLLPHTAHYLLQTLNGVLRIDPADVIKFGASVCRAGSQLNYHFDQMAISEIVKFVERILADHKAALRDREVANAVGSILDTFVQAGWAEAMQLTFRLDEAVR